jgi:TRAP-type uncharacterized transport system fused permease subunit
VISFDIIERLLFAVAGLFCVLPETKTDIIGLSLMAVLLVYQGLTKKFNYKK